MFDIALPLRSVLTINVKHTELLDSAGNPDVLGTAEFSYVAGTTGSQLKPCYVWKF